MGKSNATRKKCRTCKGRINMMAQIGTGYCSQNCEDAASPDPTINHSAGVRPHRSVATTPTESRRTTTFGV